LTARPLFCKLLPFAILAKPDFVVFIDTVQARCVNGRDDFCFVCFILRPILELLKAGEIHLLVTSRSTLALAASTAFLLTGLETPVQASAEAMQNESVRLFVERAVHLPVVPPNVWPKEGEMARR
jgi:hypothetical protein